MSDRPGDKKRDLQGWAMVAATRQSTLNTGLKKLHEVIPAEYRSITFATTVDGGPLGKIKVSTDKAALGVIQVKAVLDGQKRTNVHIPFDSGKFVINDSEYNLEGSWLEVDISLIAFQVNIDSKDGQHYDVHIDVKDDFAVFKADGNIDGFPRQFLGLAMKEALRSLAGKSYYVYSFTVDKDFQYKNLIPSQIEATFVFNEKVNEKSVFCALMATKEIPAPTEASRYAFTEDEVIDPDRDLVINVGNMIFTDTLYKSLKTTGPFKDSTWTKEGDSPVALTLSGTISNINDGADLTSCVITATKGRIIISLKVQKEVTPGITLTMDTTQKIKPVWNGKVIKLQEDGNPEWHHTIDEALWLKILSLIPNIVGSITLIVTAIIKLVIDHNIPDVGSMLKGTFDKFQVPITLPKVLVSAGVVISTFKINYYGSVRFGIDFKHL